MAWPLALATIGGAVLGGMFGKESNEDNRAQSEAFAQHGIRWRVADAKAAGLHPLFALGGSSPSFAPAQPVMTAAEGAQMGQSLGRAIAGNELEQAQLALVKAQTAKTDMEKLQIASDIKRQEAAQVGASPVAQAFPVQMPGAPGMGQYGVRNLGEINPDGSWMLPQPSPLMATQHPPPYLSSLDAKPALRPWAVAGIPGGQVLLPDASNFAEALESLENPINQAFVLQQNASHYGPAVYRWLADALKKAARGELSRGGVGSAIHRWSIK